jgi:hypothetical protein
MLKLEANAEDEGDDGSPAEDAESATQDTQEASSETVEAHEDAAVQAMDAESSAAATAPESKKKAKRNKVKAKADSAAEQSADPAAASSTPVVAASASSAPPSSKRKHRAARSEQEAPAVHVEPAPAVNAEPAPAEPEQSARKRKKSEAIATAPQTPAAKALPKVTPVCLFWATNTKLCFMLDPSLAISSPLQRKLTHSGEGASGPSQRGHAWLSHEEPRQHALLGVCLSTSWHLLCGQRDEYVVINDICFLTSW